MPQKTAKPQTLLQNLAKKYQLRSLHSRELKKMKLPKWMERLSCEECGRPMGRTGVKKVTLDLGAARMKNIVLEILCPRCSSSYDLHYRNCCNTFWQFIDKCCNHPSKLPDPIADHLIPIQENNLMEVVAEELMERRKNKSQVKK
jgi:hypothetical protein